MDAVTEAIVRTKRLAAQHLVRKEDLEAELGRLAAGDPRIAEVAKTELAAATQDYRDALAELATLDDLGRQARQAEARAIAGSVSGDPLIRTLEEQALDNAREHLADLDAQSRLSDELGGSPRSAPAPKPSREQADAAARLEFEALRAKRQNPSESADGPPRTTKKTL